MVGLQVGLKRSTVSHCIVTRTGSGSLVGAMLCIIERNGDNVEIELEDSTRDFTCAEPSRVTYRFRRREGHQE